MRTFWVYFNGIIATVVLSVCCIVLGLVGYRGNIFDWIAHTWARWILWASGVEVRVEGMENVHANNAQIISSNHQSWFDVFALASVIPKRFRFIAKEELTKIPLFGQAWQAAGHISIRRQDRTQSINALDAAAKLVRSDNSSIVIFPEGTRSLDGNLQPFKKGAFMLALRTGLEIVPAAIVGSRAIRRKSDYHIYPGPVVVRFGEPVDSSQFNESQRDELMAVVRERINALLNHPLRERDRVGDE